MKVDGDSKLIITQPFPADVLPATALLHPGDEVASIEEVSIADRYRSETPMISAATEQWRRHVALGRLTERDAVGPTQLSVLGIDGTFRAVSVDAVSTASFRPLLTPRPAAGAELAPGVIYFDLNGAGKPALHAQMKKLGEAKAVIFDARGYPGDAGYDLFQYIITSTVHSAWWCIPVSHRPGREHWTWEESHWTIAPAKKHIPGKLVFITDGSAISYAESCMAIVEHERLGAIVGSPTAGTNGNVNPMLLPGGYQVMWTGMKVVKHDRSPHHGVGVLPTVPIEPTREGIAAGKDELIEKAIEIAQQP